MKPASATPSYRTGTDADLPCVARLIQHAFAGTVEAALKWLADAGVQNLRVVGGEQAAGAPPQACLLRIPMGQFFGGRSVPMVGIAGVAVAPEARGQGLAKSLMRSALLEARAGGAALSCLYASTQSLYRGVGFEQAGYMFHSTIPVERLTPAFRDGRELRAATTIRPLGEQDEMAIRECYAAWARTTNGMLDRGPYVWQRTRRFRDDSYSGFGVFGADNTLEGYVFLAQRRGPVSGRHDIALSDIAWRTPRAARRLLLHLNDFATMGESVELFGGPMHPLFHLLDQQRYAAHHKDIWMLRLLDVPAALEARGYPAPLACSVNFHLSDDAFPENAGAWTLRIEHGRGRVSRSAHDGSPAATLDIKALAPIYSGFLTASQSRSLGSLEADDEIVAALDASFAGGVPTMADRF